MTTTAHIVAECDRLRTEQVTLRKALDAADAENARLAQRVRDLEAKIEAADITPLSVDFVRSMTDSLASANTECADLRARLLAAGERIAAQAELLARRAERPNPIAEQAAADLAALAASRKTPDRDGRPIAPGDVVSVQLRVVALPAAGWVICETADGRRVGFDAREFERVERVPDVPDWKRPEAV